MDFSTIDQLRFFTIVAYDILSCVEGTVLLEKWIKKRPVSEVSRLINRYLEYD